MPLNIINVVVILRSYQKIFNEGLVNNFQFLKKNVDCLETILHVVVQCVYLFKTVQRCLFTTANVFTTIITEIPCVLLETCRIRYNSDVDFAISYTDCI